MLQVEGIGELVEVPYGIEKDGQAREGKQEVGKLQEASKAVVARHTPPALSRHSHHSLSLSIRKLISVPRPYLDQANSLLNQAGVLVGQ